MRLRLRFLPALALLVALLVGGATAPVQAQTPRLVLGCGAEYEVTSQWSTGFVAQVVVTNTGTAPISQWRATVTLPGATFQQGWYATFFLTITGDIIIHPDQWNATIAPGASSVPVGFVASGDPAPSGIGVTCRA